VQLLESRSTSVGTSNDECTCTS